VKNYLGYVFPFNNQLTMLTNKAINWQKRPYWKLMPIHV